MHRAVQALAEGKLVCFPTETVYGMAASALDEQAVLRLLEVKRRRRGQALSLAVKSADAAFDYVPRLEPLGRRLARRCWPGPVTLVLQDNDPDSLIRQLPPKVQQSVVPAETIGLRVPAHRLILEVLAADAGSAGLDQCESVGAAGSGHGAGRRGGAASAMSIWCWTTDAASSLSPPPWSRFTTTNCRCCAPASCPRRPCSDWPA